MPADPSLKRKGTGQIIPQGQTASDYGSDPSLTSKNNGVARPLKP